MQFEELENRRIAARNRMTLAMETLAAMLSLLAAFHEVQVITAQDVQERQVKEYEALAAFLEALVEPTREAQAALAALGITRPYPVVLPTFIDASRPWPLEEPHGSRGEAGPELQGVADPD